MSEQGWVFMQVGKKEGAKLLTGGARPPHLQKGFFIQPTVFTDVTPDMTIWKQEIFGPVLATATFSDEAEAVRIANESEFGLGAAVVSADKQVCVCASPVSTGSKSLGRECASVQDAQRA